MSGKGEKEHRRWQPNVLTMRGLKAVIQNCSVKRCSITRSRLWWDCQASFCNSRTPWDRLPLCPAPSEGRDIGICEQGRAVFGGVGSQMGFDHENPAARRKQTWSLPAKASIRAGCYQKLAAVLKLA